MHKLQQYIATCKVKWLPDDHEFVLFCLKTGMHVMIPFHFYNGVRALHGNRWNRLTFLPHYQRVKNLQWPFFRRTKKHEQDIVHAIVSGFNGERPKMLPEIQLLKDSEVHHGSQGAS